MTLKDLELQITYSSPDDVYKKFFNKVLKESNECLRFGGIFNSRTFAGCAEGMQEFVQNNTGKRIRSRNKGYKLGRHMGYISTVNDAKELLEKLYKMTHEPPQR